jgi:hypothetical protein
VNWNNHFHVIEKLSNERFELKKSGIAELKLLPLKERLTRSVPPPPSLPPSLLETRVIFFRFAAISVRESIPQPFCDEKKLTDSLILNNRATDPRDLYQLVINEQQHQHQHQHHHQKKSSSLDYDRTANPFYDAEVEEDLKTIQRRYREKEEMKKMKLKKKMIQAAIKSIPHVDYHPDEVVIAMAKDEEQEQEQEQNEYDITGGGGRDVYGESGFVSEQDEQNLEERTKYSQQMKAKAKKEKERKKKRGEEDKEKSLNRTREEGSVEISEQQRSPSLRKGKQPKGSEKIFDYQKVYGITLGPLERLELTKKKNFLNSKSSGKGMGKSKGDPHPRPPSPVKDDTDPIFSHVMQPFQEYFIGEEEREKMREEWEKERKEREELELKKMRSQSADLGGDGDGRQEIGGEGYLHGDGLYGGEDHGDGEEEERYDDQGIFERAADQEMEGEGHDAV